MKNNELNSGFGISTLVMIFMVLCLSIFATLTYLQANYNYTQSEKIVESKKEYYGADYKATLLYQELKEALDNNDINDTWLENKNIEYRDGVYCYNISVDENKALNIELKYEDNDLKVLRWQESVNHNDTYDYNGFVD